jgi:lipid-A-disaccharide synthase
MTRPFEANGGPLHVFIIVGEESGDQLGAALMQALSARLDGRARFSGVGGHAMAAQGLTSLFPLADIALAGFLSVARRLPQVLARIRQAAHAVVEANPDVLVIIDSPDFTHRVARRVRAAAPGIPIVNYVSPSVWAWRARRAPAMRAYVDHVMALLPFEPAAHLRLGGPPCTYVGHPLASRVADLRPSAAEALRRAADPPVVLVLPGSRMSEIRQLLPRFRQAIESLNERAGPLDLVLATVPHLVSEIEAASRTWRARPRIVVSTEEKYAAFRIARVGLAASGTVTLELALAGVPTVAAYRVQPIEAAILRRVIRVPSVILANLVLGENVVPEFLQEACTPERLAEALAVLLGDTPERRRQVEAFERLDEIMQIGKIFPEERAADIVIACAGTERRNGRANTVAAS